MDELIFDALAPRTLRSVVNAVAPLVYPPLARWRGLDLKACGTLLLVGVILVPALLSPTFGLLGTVRNLREAHTTLCGGRLDFVYGQNGAGVPFWAPATLDARADERRPFEMEPGNSFATAMMEAVIDVSNDDACVGCVITYDGTETEEMVADMMEDLASRQCCFSVTYRLPTLEGGANGQTLQEMNTGTAYDAAIHLNYYCKDVLDRISGSLNTVRRAVGYAVDPAPCGGACPLNAPFCNSSGTCVKPRCDQHAAPYCNDESVMGTRFRQLCPETCGCDVPRSSLVLSSPTSGCGQCDAVSQTYQAEMDALPCEDVAPDDAQWNAFLDAFEAVAEGYAGFDRWVQFYIDAFRQNGCASFTKSSAIGASSYTWGIDPCREAGEGGWMFAVKPLSYFCPVSCGCRGTDAHCPNSCPADATHWWYRNESAGEAYFAR